MKLIKHALVIFLFTYVPQAAFATLPGRGVLHVTSVEPKDHFVVSPGTRLVAGDRKLNEFYILGARTENSVAMDHAGVKRVPKLVKKDDMHQVKKVLREALHRSNMPVATKHQLATKTHHKSSGKQRALAKLTKLHPKIKLAKATHKKLIAANKKRHQSVMHG
jgi:hypothetical protein